MEPNSNEMQKFNLYLKGEKRIIFYNNQRVAQVVLKSNPYLDSKRDSWILQISKNIYLEAAEKIKWKQDLLKKNINESYKKICWDDIDHNISVNITI